MIVALYFFGGLFYVTSHSNAKIFNKTQTHNDINTTKTYLKAKFSDLCFSLIPLISHDFL